MLVFYQLKDYDKEVESFTNHVTEFDVTFPPSYPFEEKINEAKRYMLTRCPSWCDRVLLSHSAKNLILDSNKIKYGLMGTEICMGDHKVKYTFCSFHSSNGTICEILFLCYLCSQFIWNFTCWFLNKVLFIVFIFITSIC